MCLVVKKSGKSDTSHGKDVVHAVVNFVCNACGSANQVGVWSCFLSIIITKVN